MFRVAAVCFAVGFSAALSACGVSPARDYRDMQDAQQMEVRKVSGRPYDYDVAIVDAVTMGMGLDEQSNRLKAAVTVLADRCADPRLVGENVQDDGRSLLGAKKTRYTLHMKCSA